MFFDFSKRTQFEKTASAFWPTRSIFGQNHFFKKKNIKFPSSEKVYTKNQVFTGITKPSQRQIEKIRFFTPDILQSPYCINLYAFQCLHCLLQGQTNICYILMLINICAEVQFYVT